MYIIGYGNLTYHMKLYFPYAKVHSTHFNESLPLNEIKDNDIVIYNHSSSLNTFYTKEDGEHDINYLLEILEKIKNLNIKFIYISTISIYDKNSLYGLYKKKQEDIILKYIPNSFIIRPTSIRYFKTLKPDDKSTLENYALNYNHISLKASMESAKNNGTYPIPVYKILWLIDDIVNNNVQKNMFNIQGPHYFSRYDTIIQYGAEIEYGNDLFRTINHSIPYDIKKKICCLICAGGTAERFHKPKQFLEFGNYKLVEITYKNIHKYFDKTIVAINEIYKDIEITNIPKENIIYVHTNSRIDTIKESLKYLNEYYYVCITEANKPQMDIKLLIEMLCYNSDIIVGRINMDSCTDVSDKNHNWIERNDLYQNAINIYQVDLLKSFINNVKDNEFKYLLEHYKEKIKFVDKQGGVRPFKITYPEDIMTLNAFN